MKHIVIGTFTSHGRAQAARQAAIDEQAVIDVPEREITRPDNVRVRRLPSGLTRSKRAALLGALAGAAGGALIGAGLALAGLLASVALAIAVIAFLGAIYGGIQGALTGARNARAEIEAMADKTDQSNVLAVRVTDLEAANDIADKWQKMGATRVRVA